MELGQESFFADGSIIGGRHFYNGKMQIAKSKIGKRSFIGNSAIMPIGKSVGDQCLIGCMSTPPLSEEQTPHSTEWLGSPSFRLPFRKKVEGFKNEVIYKPTTKLYIQRLLVDAMRILLPGYIGIVSGISFLFALYYAYQFLGTYHFIFLSPILSFSASVMSCLMVVFFKKLIMGTFKPVIRPLWSLYVWFNEVVNGAYESVSAPLLSGFLGTPFYAIYLRLLGAKIGKRVYLGTTLFSEFDLVKIGDYAALNAGVVIQNHLFEDRIMKSSYLNIGESCSIGNMSVILYDTLMENESHVGSMSLLMKGETLPK